MKKPFKNFAHMYCLLTRKEHFGIDSGALLLENGMIKVQMGEPRTENGFQLPSQSILKDCEQSVSMKHHMKGICA